MKRSRSLIVSQILEICTLGASKTKIVYQANLNFKTVNPYLDMLTKNGLINVKDKDGPKVIYETTKRGLDLLENFRHIQDELAKI